MLKLTHPFLRSDWVPPETIPCHNSRCDAVMVPTVESGFVGCGLVWHCFTCNSGSYPPDLEWPFRIAEATFDDFLDIGFAVNPLTGQNDYRPIFIAGAPTESELIKELTKHLAVIFQLGRLTSDPMACLEDTKRVLIWALDRLFSILKGRVAGPWECPECGVQVLEWARVGRCPRCFFIRGETVEMQHQFIG